METLRTPDERFEDLPGWSYAPRYAEVDGVRIHYVDEGPAEADPVLLLHGEPTWAYLYRHVIAVLLQAGHRVVAPDLVGFGRSDKPVAVEDHTYAAHVGWVGGFMEAVDLQRVTLVCQDWGGLIGLRLLAERPEHFARVVTANTGLPTGDQQMPELWLRFRDWVRDAEELPVSFLVRSGCAEDPGEEAVRAYDAPFPEERFKAGPRALPGILPTTPEDPAAAANRAAWARLSSCELPWLCLYSDGDPITAGAERPFLERVPGTRGQPHATIRGAGHFLQEDAGAELAERIVAWLAGDGGSGG